MMNWMQIEPALARQAAEAAGYTVVYSGIVSGWGCRWSEEDGRNASWGWNTEEEAWAEAFRHLCETRDVYRDKKGDIYVEMMRGRFTCGIPGVKLAGIVDDRAVIYRQLAPHEPDALVRSLAEFEEEGRFVRIES